MTDQIAALILFLFPLAYSPGPGNLYFAALGAHSGWRGSIAASAGYHVATWIVTFAVGFGFVETLRHLPVVFALLSWAGSAYLVWLAWRFLQAGHLQGRVTERTARFGDGVMLFVLNPKAYVIIALMFSQFLDAMPGGFLERLVVITSVFTLNNLLAFLIWTLLGEGLGRLFRTPPAARILNACFAAALAGTALWMLGQEWARA